MEIQQDNTISEEERQIRIQAVTDQMLKGFMTASTDVSKFQIDLATSAALFSKRVIEQNQIDIDKLIVDLQSSFHQFHCSTYRDYCPRSKLYRMNPKHIFSCYSSTLQFQKQLSS